MDHFLKYRAGFFSVKERVYPPNPLYVNTLTGKANGTGSISNPVNSLAVAITLCAGLPDYVVKVTAPQTNPLRQQVTYESSLDVVIEGNNNEPWHIYGSEEFTSGWEVVSGSLYKRTLNWTAAAPVTIKTLRETILGKSFEVKLLPNTETPASPLTGEYGYSNGVLYIRLPDQSNPNNHKIEVGRRNTNLLTTGFGRLTVANVVSRYSIGGGIVNGLSSQPVGTGILTVRNSEISYTGGNGIGAAGTNVESIISDTTAFRNSNDGFNLHNPMGGFSYMQLNNCDGSYNGDSAGQSAQGCSNHGITQMDVNGGRYDGNVSGGMVVIEDGICNFDGTSEYGPIIMDKNMRLGNTKGTIAGQAGSAWLDNATGVVKGSVTVSNGLGVGVRNDKPVQGIETIKSVNNALPDLLVLK